MGFFPYRVGGHGVEFMEVEDDHESGVRRAADGAIERRQPSSLNLCAASIWRNGCRLIRTLSKPASRIILK